MQDAVSFLMALPRFTDQGGAAYKPGFERIEALLEAMGRPQDRYATVHIAGTNGKGSTCSMVAAIATAAGLRVGLHTSPHIFRLHERMRVNGVPASDAWLDGAVARFEELFREVRPSFFEALVALSLLYFAEEKVDLAVVEVGMGGRLDATNVLQPRVSVITSIGLDHTEFLGNTLPAIAREKAGIIKAGVPVVFGDENEEVSSVFHETAAERGTPVHDVRVEVGVREVEAEPDGLILTFETPLRRYDSLALDLHGRHQVKNAQLAVRAAELALDAVRHDARPVYEGLSAVRKFSGLRGRLEVLPARRFMVMDVGHNPDGLATALDFMQARGFGPESVKVVFGVMHDKDVAQMSRLLAERTSGVFVVRLGGERAFAAEELAELLRQDGNQVAGPGTVPEGIAWFERTAGETDGLLVTGSHLVVAGVPEFQS